MHKISMYSWFGFPLPMEERFRMIKAAGFDGVLLWWSDEYADTDGTKVFQVEAARKRGLLIDNVHAPYQNVNAFWEAGTAGDAIEKLYRDCILDCAEQEIPTVVLHVSQGEDVPASGQAGLDRMKRLVEAAERKNMNIALENLRKPELLDFIFANLQSERLGFCYDAGHEHCWTKEANLLEKYGSKLMGVHLHDNDGFEDLHQVPGDGKIHWKTVANRLAHTGYAGPVALEITNKYSLLGDSEIPEWFLKRAIVATKKYLLDKSGDFYEI